VNESLPFDYIIVGQGLAGSAVAVQLLLRDKKIVVIDEYDKNYSSRVAAGLFNPITGKKLIKSWLVDELFPYLHRFYPQIEQLTGKKFFFKIPLYKVFSSVAEQNEWMGRSVESSYRSYVDELHTQSPFETSLDDPFGGMMLRHTGYINTTIYGQAVREYIREQAIFMDEHFDEDLLNVHREYVEYKGYRAGKIIFCQGEHTAFNKWFKDLAVYPLKGEILTIKTAWEKQVIVNSGVYMVPGGDAGEYRVGSTYNFNDNTAGTTEQGRVELEDKLKKLIRFPYTVLRQEWGRRPTTSNRKPILGCHPFSERLVIFNGLGTKGVSLAPYFSEILIRWLENNGPIEKDVDVTRYKLLY
jgi:glycine oxidase